MIQIITGDLSKYTEYSKNKYKIYALDDFEVFDSFEVVYIDLTDKNT